MKSHLGNVTRSIALIGWVFFSFAGAGMAAQDVGYDVTGQLWVKAVLQVATTPVTPVTLVWKPVGTDTTPSGDQVISGYFYADPADFAYGSPYNPELFVKIYIATNGWCNMAFNHVTVDDVTIFSAHNYNGAADQTGTVSTVTRLVEHQYTGVGISSDSNNLYDFNGVWIFEATDETQSKIYLIGNETGIITEYSGIIRSGHGTAPPGGTYLVNSDGTFSMALDIEDNEKISVTGVLSSESAGDVISPDNGTIHRVTDLGFCQGTWEGTLREVDTTTVFQINFTVDGNGVVTSFNGLTGPVTGKVFAEAGKVAAYFKTGEAGYYNQVSFDGTVSEGSISGYFSYDGPGDDQGVVNLTKTGGAQ